MALAKQSLRCTKEPYVEDVGPRKIESVKFSTFSGDDIRKMAELQVWNNKLYNPDHQAAQNGLLDTRMGPTRKGLICATCHGNFEDCPGHFGYLKLTLPVFNIGYFNTILNILKCICKSCGRILLPENIRRQFLKKMRNPKAEILQKDAYFKKIRNHCKASRCMRCGYINGVVKKARASSLGILHDFNKIKDDSIDEYRSALSHLKEKPPFLTAHILTPDRVLTLFKKMLYEDFELLCLNDRPEKLLVTDIAVPPVAVRPSSIVEFQGSSREDSITSMLKEIINTNSILREDLEGAAPPNKCLDSWGILQVQVAEYINSGASCVPDSKQKGFVQRLKGKQGRFRGNLSGKRVDFTGRTVISPDPNLKITEVGIPLHMARTLTYPERVSQHNIEKLRMLVQNGPFKHPGANFVIHPNGTRIYLKYERKNAANELKYGYIVERHLDDGDIVLFNRQPSLHRMSIMSHRAKVMSWRTLRFNESVCNPYNADFDGDEMNLHVPQTEEARTEAMMLMGVQNNLCTPKNGQILVASTQDFLTSSFLITRRDTFYDRASFSLMCSYVGDGMDHIDLPSPSIIKPMELWTGKQLFSVLVRPNAQTKVFLNLVVKEKAYKSGDSMCINECYVYFRNSELICGQLGKATLGNGSSNGLFTVLIRDYNAHAAASCMNRLAKLSARWIGNHGFSIGIDDVQPGDRLNNQKKIKIEQGYKACHEFINKFNTGELPPQPGCDAAQTLETEITNVLNEIRGATGDVCMKELHWRNSPLIMSQCGSKGSAINISQMIACVGQQSVGGRRAPNGFIDRTLPHFRRNSKTPVAKGFVANSFYSGLTATEFFFHTMGGREGLVDTAVKTAQTGYMSRRLIKCLEDLAVYYDQTVRDATGGTVQFLYGDDGMDPAKMEGKNGEPLNFDQLLGKVMATCPSHSTTLSASEIRKIKNDRLSKHDMTPEGGCSSAFKDLISDFIENVAESLEKTRRSLKLDVNQSEDGNNLESLAARLSGLSYKQLQVFLETCISRYHSKKIEAGAAVGAVGAQSIGEPGTQMTLKTFHFAGVASMNITLGVPRILEIIDAKKKISTPIITAALECDDDVKSARIVKGCIEKTLLGEVARSMKLVFKSSQSYISVVLDTELIEALYMGISAYTVRQSILADPKIKLRPEHIQVPAAYKLRICPLSSGKDLQSELHALKAILPNVIVKGIASVKRVVISSEKKKNKSDCTTEEKPKYKLFVEGTNLLAVMGIPGVKGTATTSNHVIEVQKTLGIEAARRCIIDEINYTMKGHGMNIDIRHMMLLAEVMTYKGEVLGMTRDGIKRMKHSVLMLASFEKTADHLFNASVNGRQDRIDGVTECIIMGIPMQLGTGMLNVMQSVDVPELKYELDPILS